MHLPWTRALASVALVAATTLGSIVPAAADDQDDAVLATDLTPDEFIAAFDDAVLPGLAPIGPAPATTGDPVVDDLIRTIGEQRGYRRRAEPSVELVAVDGFRLQPDAAAAWEALQSAAAGAGHTISITSAFRSGSSQASILRSRLGGTSASAIDARLDTVAPPGYSRHHTGYTVDIRSSTAGGFAFRDSAAYAWLAADNFANAKLYGWIPSYPEGAVLAGPVPEPWELSWVGATNIICADFEGTEATPFCDTMGSSFADDVKWLHDEKLTTGCSATRFCIDSTVTRGQAAAFLWRVSGSPVATAELEFDDVRTDAYYTEPIRWMVEHDITTGTTPTTFEPDASLTRAQFVTFLWRLAAMPAAAATHPFDDVSTESYANGAIAWAAEVGVTTGTSPTMFSPDDTGTRGQAAAFLHRYVDLVA